MNLDTLAARLHNTATEKGFWEPLSRMENQDTFVFYAKQIAMIQSEATEVLEALRKSHGADKVVEELADIIIRTLDLWKGLTVYDSEEYPSLEDMVMSKSITNQTRPKLHGVKG